MIENGTADQTVTTLFAATVTARSSAIAVEDERESVTYDDLSGRVSSLAATLAESGVGRGDRVAVVLPNSLAFVESFLAVVGCGAAVVPIGFGAQPAEIERVLADAGVGALIAAPECTARTPANVAHLVACTDSPSLRIERTCNRGNTPRAPAPEDAAVVAYSFTSSPPCLVVRTHENLRREVESFWSATQLGAGDVILGVVPLSHAHGLGNALLATLRSGGRLVLRTRFLRRQTLDTLVQRAVTVFPTVPFMARMLEITDRRRSWDLGAMRLCISAGAPLTRDVYNAFLGRFRVPLRQLYGLTAAGNVTMNRAPLSELEPLSVGSPLPGVEVTIADASGNEAPRGASGEVVVRSAAAAGGTARPLRTGDVGRWSENGELTLTGRASRFVNAAGNKVDPGEVEVVLRAHPAVRDAMVLGIPTAHGDETVAAIVVRRGPCTEHVLRVHCCTRLATYKVPRLFDFRAALPATVPRGALALETLAGT